MNVIASASAMKMRSSACVRSNVSSSVSNASISAVDASERRRIYRVVDDDEAELVELGRLRGGELPVRTVVRLPLERGVPRVTIECVEFGQGGEPTRTRIA